MLKPLAALALIALASPAFAQAGDPNAMKCVEFMNLSAEGMDQMARALEQQLTGKDELNPELVRHLGNVCPMNPELTVAEAAAKK
jgi:hypothetical protein